MISRGWSNTWRIVTRGWTIRWRALRGLSSLGSTPTLGTAVQVIGLQFVCDGCA